MSTDERGKSETSKNTNIKVRVSERLRDRVDRIVADHDDHTTRSELIREATRRLVLDTEVRERLDGDEPNGGDRA